MNGMKFVGIAILNLLHAWSDEFDRNDEKYKNLLKNLVGPFSEKTVFLSSRHP
jgi:hypothetical protein